MRVKRPGRTHLAAKLLNKQVMVMAVAYWEAFLGHIGILPRLQLSHPHHPSRPGHMLLLINEIGFRLVASMAENRIMLRWTLSIPIGEKHGVLRYGQWELRTNKFEKTRSL